MELKDYNRCIDQWQRIAHDVKNDNRQSLIDVVSEYGGDEYYMKTCTKKQAMTQIKLEIDDLLDEREKEKLRLEQL